MIKKLEVPIFILLIVILICIIHIVIQIENIKDNNKNNVNNINNTNNRNNNTNDNNLLRNIVEESNKKQSKDILWYIGHRFFNNIIVNCKNEKVKENDYYKDKKNDINLDLKNFNSYKTFWSYANGEEKVEGINTTQ